MQLHLGNVALGKYAKQPDQWIDFVAMNAVDGDTNPNLNAGSCAVSLRNSQNEAQWQVDLGSLHVVLNVSVYNRDYKPCNILNI